MDVISYTAFRKELATMLDKVSKDHSPIMVTRQNGEPAVLMSVADFLSYEETSYLMASKNNAERLQSAMKELDTKKGLQEGLIEP